MAGLFGILRGSVRVGLFGRQGIKVVKSQGTVFHRGGGKQKSPKIVKISIDILENVVIN